MQLYVGCHMLVLESGGNDDVYGPDAVSPTYIAIGL